MRMTSSSGAPPSSARSSTPWRYDLARVSNANLKARLAEVDRARIALAEKAARAWGAANHQPSPEA
jgi:hypothetical protein